MFNSKKFNLKTGQIFIFYFIIELDIVIVIIIYDNLIYLISFQFNFGIYKIVAILLWFPIKSCSMIVQN